MSHPINDRGHYEHEQYGHVRVVDSSGGEVAFEHTSETVLVEGDQIPKAWTESIEEFADRTEPADVTVGASSESLQSNQ